ncbi:Hypothetical Protein FCC1311_049182 [Hondaea fermentalgiana]|uniref:Uncharacterized protein n=1 Tax=Hondaea fermentalgiana TaxID=2315210 RepID=A0A2R5GCJ0_9STRA|nr:Hypothetical Protein FCC1311_049182 [Hondaea fermentalgiana]|eukprot:GBG28697.1 Hypothetical Protein FCC1311_049182 [Hondaea fermentalgiana]
MGTAASRSGDRNADEAWESPAEERRPSTPTRALRPLKAKFLARAKSEAPYGVKEPHEAQPRRSRSLARKGHSAATMASTSPLPTASSSRARAHGLIRRTTSISRWRRSPDARQEHLTRTNSHSGGSSRDSFCGGDYGAYDDEAFESNCPYGAGSPGSSVGRDDDGAFASIIRKAPRSARKLAENPKRARGLARAKSEGGAVLAQRNYSAMSWDEFKHMPVPDELAPPLPPPPPPLPLRMPSSAY